jgi:DNA-binding NarL/FixJ family response regulator
MAVRVTRREAELLELVRQGFSNREIASRLGVGEQTVKNAFAVLFQKFGVRNRTQLATSRQAVEVRARSK